jgi:predicted nucleotidyltransferase
VTFRRVPKLFQQALIDVVARTLEADVRIASLWLSGSFGRDQADSFSDVDFLAVVPDGKPFELVAEYARIPSAFGEIVHARVLFGRIVTAVMRDLARFDVFFATESELAHFDSTSLRPLFTRGAGRPAGSATAAAEPSKVEANIAEFLRMLALLPVVVGREEYIVGMDGATHLRRMLIETMLEQNGVTAAMRGGALKLNRFLTAEQRAELHELPPLTPTRESVVGMHLALARVFLPRARALAEARGIPWPDDFERAVRHGLEERLALMHV